MNPKQERLLFREKEKTGTTSGLCPNYVQANLVSIPKEYAFDFLLFCYRNPKSCPLVDVLEAGEFTPSVADADIRTDLPRYRIYHYGKLSEEVLDVSSYWQEDFVTFLLGCSFTFEEALKSEGLPLKHQEQNKVVPMFKTNIPLEKAGRFQGEMVVSMRAIPVELVEKTIEVSKRFEHAHGTPVHVGNPEEIGIQDILKPDYGEAISFDRDQHIPVFWACGVTPQNALIHADLPITITHAPGHMLITDEIGT